MDVYDTNNTYVRGYKQIHMVGLSPFPVLSDDMKQFCCKGISINLHMSTVGKLNPKLKFKKNIERPYCYHTVDGRNPEQVDS